MIRNLFVKSLRPLNSVSREQGLVARSFSSETYSERQAKKGRPVSPHVTIYKFPPAAISSITNRVTGVILTGGRV